MKCCETFTARFKALRAEPAHGIWHPFGHPNSRKIALARAVCAKVRARAPLNAKKRTFGGPKVPKSATMDPKWTQNGSKWEPKMCQKSKLCKKVPNVVWTHYLLYILTTGTLQKPHFLTPPSNQNAGLFRVVPRMPPRGCKMAPTGPKNGESGVPRDPQGFQRVSQCSLKCSKKSSKISTPLQDCLQGCF